eukprot:2382893-Pyramimonas_sp.AAC.2
MVFALHGLARCATVPGFDDLLKAGEAMVEFMDIIKAAPMRVPETTCQRLYELMMIHIVRSGSAGISFTPKHDFAMHLTDRTGECSNGACTGNVHPPSPIIIMARTHRVMC